MCLFGGGEYHDYTVLEIYDCGHPFSHISKLGGPEVWNWNGELPRVVFPCRDSAKFQPHYSEHNFAGGYCSGLRRCKHYSGQNPGDANIAQDKIWEMQTLLRTKSRGYHCSGQNLGDENIAQDSTGGANITQDKN